MGCVINAEIDLRVGKAEHLFRLGRRPTQHRFDPRPQLSRAERFRNVVIGAEFESEDLFGLMRFRRQQNDRNLAAAPTYLSTDLEPVLAREHHVQQDEIEGFALCHTNCIVAGGHQRHYVSFGLEVRF
jgi:hypothetical protein